MASPNAAVKAPAAVKENNVSDIVQDANANKKGKAKATFMLHDADTMSSIGKYQSTDYRYAALKAASKGAEKILLRKTNTKEVREFSGNVITLDQPKEINRGDRVIKYTKKPTVKFLRKFTFTGELEDDEDQEQTAGQANVEPALQQVEVK